MAPAIMGVADPGDARPTVTEPGYLERPCTFLPRTRHLLGVIASSWICSWREEDTYIRSLFTW